MRPVRTTFSLSILHREYLLLQHMTNADFAAIADTSPGLQHLHLERSAVCGAVFTPLSKLSSLLTLRLYQVYAVQGKELAIESLSSLTNLFALTSLCVGYYRYGFVNRLEPPPGFLGNVALLPWVSTLHRLRDLKLDIADAPDGACEALGSAMANLSQLTSLKVGGVCLPPDCQLACAAKLKHLAVMDVESQEPDIRFYASLPCLRTLELEGVELDTDLSHLPCTWRRLKLEYPPPPDQLATCRSTLA